MECTLPFRAEQPGMRIPCWLLSVPRVSPGSQGSGVEPTSRDQQIELYESLFSARRPFLLTETHTANLSTGAWNINGPLAGKPLERSRRSQSSRCTQQGLVLKGLMCYRV